LEEIVAAPVKKTENTTGGIRCADHATSSTRKSWYYFAKKRRSLGRHSSLADQSHGVFFTSNVLSMSGAHSDERSGLSSVLVTVRPLSVNIYRFTCNTHVSDIYVQGLCQSRLRTADHALS
jgi:hypothetical protein